MATIYDVCEKAGVSMATVSRVINGNDIVKKSTRQKVLKAMQSLNYTPNINAQSLASKVTNSVGILVSEISGPVYGPMMSAIEEELRASGKHVFITSGHSDEVREKESIDFLISRNCDALIMHVEAVSDEYLIELNKLSTPFVLMNRSIPCLADNCIILNNFNGGYLAAQHLLDLGHKNIAYISGPSWKSDAQDRLEGHKKALKDSGIKYNKNLSYEGDYSRESGITGLDNLLKVKEPFTAVICANDEMAAGAMVKARDEKFDIPAELSIVGYDDINMASYLHPKLTTIRNPVNDIGRMAAKLVLKNVYNKDVDETQTMFEPELIIRDSAQQLT